MERFLVVVAIIVITVVISIALRAYQGVAEPFVLRATRTPTTHNPTGRYSDEPEEGSGFFHCKRDDDTSEENASLPTCTEMRRGMIQKARDDGQIPEVPVYVRSKYPPSDKNEVTGSVGNLQVVLNRAARASRHKMCVPFVDCDRYVNPKSKRLYCPVGMSHATDSGGNTTGCQSFPENNLLHCDANATNGSGRVACSVLQNIQTVGPGFKMYPPLSILKSSLDVQTRQETESKNASTTLDKIMNERSGIILNLIRTYPNIISRAESESGLVNETQNLATTQGLQTEMSRLNSHHMSVLSQFFDGVMESYLLYQPMPGGHARVGFIHVPGVTPDITDLRAFDGAGPNYEILSSDFIPDTMTPPDGLMPVLTFHKQTNYRLPRPSNPVSRANHSDGNPRRTSRGTTRGEPGGDKVCFTF